MHYERWSRGELGRDDLRAYAEQYRFARGLTRLYELPAGAVECWDVHASADVEHADWGMEALAALDDSPSEVATSARAAADAWWSFLDEREVEYSAAR